MPTMTATPSHGRLPDLPLAEQEVCCRFDIAWQTLASAADKAPALEGNSLS
jgi:hypothetical protein